MHVLYMQIARQDVLQYEYHGDDGCDISHYTLLLPLWQRNPSNEFS